MFQFTEKKRRVGKRNVHGGICETREKWSLKVCVCINMFEFDNKDSEGQKEESC